MDKKKVFLRADGNAQMGLGHVFRLLAIADMIAENYTPVFIIRDPIAKVAEEINSRCKELKAIDTKLIQHDDEPQYLIDHYLSEGDLVVLDGYHFDTDYQNKLKSSKIKLMSIDDIYDCHFSSDIVINHAGGLTPSQYDIAPSSKLYTGLEYAILRKEFLAFAKKRNQDFDSTYPADRGNLFICLGGADPKNDTISVLEKCAHKKYPGTIYLVLGAAYRHKEALNSYIEKSTLKIHLLSNLSAEEMLHYMSISDHAITSASTISFEYMSVGGTLYLKLIAENQRAIKNYFIKEELAFDFDTDFMTINSFKKANTLKKQIEYLDGNSGKRLTNLINDLHHS